jgi:putative endonuclease
VAKRPAASRDRGRGRRAAGGHALGRAGEAAAEAHLRRRGYTILARNYRCRDGEIDLIAIHGGVLVFAEVKTRRDTSYGLPAEAVDIRKQRRLVATASHFVAESYRTLGSAHDGRVRTMRFDVIGVLCCGNGFEIEHIPDAFDLG